MSDETALLENTTDSNESKTLVEFKAGKMFMRSKTVYPDKRKGLLYIRQSEDYLIHLCWKDRTSGIVEDDLIIFPDDCEFKYVSQCTTGRVYVLKFKATNRKSFFWLQEFKTDKDEENCRRMNDVMNNPPGPGSNHSGDIIPDGDLQNLLNNISQQQLLQLFEGIGKIGGLSSLLGTMRQKEHSTHSSSVQPTNINSGSNLSISNSTGIGSAVDLSTAKDLENVESVIENKSAVNQLAPDLSTTESDPDLQPRKRTTPDESKDTIHSPQIRQAVSMFSNAFQTSQLEYEEEQFYLGEEVITIENLESLDDCIELFQQTNISDEESDDCDQD